MKLNDFEASIKWSDGSGSLPEYQIETDFNSRTTTCFIPSEAGKSFEIHLRSFRPENATAAYYLDGQRQGTSLLPPHISGSITGVLTSYVLGSSIYPFIFSDLVLSDDDGLRVDTSSVAKLGTIEIEMKRVRCAPLPSSPTGIPPKSVGPVHERSKKMGGHCISFGQLQRHPRLDAYRAMPLNPNEGYWAKFIFQYRPEGLLRAQGIIQDDDALPSSESKPTLKRSRSMAFEEREDKANAVYPNAAKAEPSSPRKKMKRESQHNDEIIDLTHIKEEPPKLLDPSLRGTVIDLTLDDE